MKRLMTKKDADDILAFAETLRLPSVSLIPDQQIQVRSATQSMLGGRPYWPDSETYPRSQNGAPLQFLAQINFAETPKLVDYPDFGLLQFFVGDTDDYFVGCKFPSLNNDGFLTVYRTDLSAPPQVIPDRETPRYAIPFQDLAMANTGVALTFAVGSILPSADDLRIENLMKPFDYKGSETSINRVLDTLAGSRTAPHYFGGHPQFVQYDIRDKPELTLYDRVLLQLGWDDLIMWGDAGEATFMIRQKDLLTLDFSKSLYSWDCG